MRRVFISLVMRVKGNVNADESRGNRVTIKKVYSSDGSVRPFVSARAVRRAIRERLLEKGFDVDPLAVESGEGGQPRLQDIGDPVRYVDDDLFGYLYIKRRRRGEGGEGVPRKSPVKVSYLFSIGHAEVVVERGGRFPRPNTGAQVDPTPFEIEVADFVGLLNVIVEDRIGIFTKKELKEDVLKEHKDKLLSRGDEVFLLDSSERKRRAKGLFEILLHEGWMFPRASTSLNYTEFYYAVVATSEAFVPLGGFVNILEDSKLDLDKIKNFIRFYGDKVNDLYVINFGDGKILELNRNTGELEESGKKINEIIDNLVNFLIQ